MNQRSKQMIVVLAVCTAAAIVSGTIFYKFVVGKGSTNIFSVIFGWQWMYLAIVSLVVLVIAIFTKQKNYMIASGILLASLAILLISARLVESNRLYITGDGGPAGPEFACLVWKNSNINVRSGAYSDSLGLCTLMSIPSYNKFLMDGSPDADRSDSSATYYIVLAVNELVILGGGWLAYQKLTSKHVSSAVRPA